MAPQGRPQDNFRIDENAGSVALTSGINVYPSKRETLIKDPQSWVTGRQLDEGVYPYWRVHDKLYDLTNFVDSHPGGKFWLETTRGMDVTEAFESAHSGVEPVYVLKKHYVRDAKEPRISPFTFHDDGFYRTLKRRVAPILKRVGTSPDSTMLRIQDSLLAGLLICWFLAAFNGSYAWAIIAGVLLGLVAICAHNFFHQKDNWRMYAFDLTMLSSGEWRISHGLSHHIYPNTILDYEIAGFEPHLELLPKRDKKGKEGVISLILAFPLTYVLAFHVEFLRRLGNVLLGGGRLRFENLFPLVELVAMVAINGSFEAFWIWALCHTVSGVVFILVGTTAGHHHPEIFHEGDAAPRDKDWGLHQVIATRERGQMFTTSVFLATVSFGNHTLHHLFPTVDHSKLPYLREAFLDTCQEFGINFEMYTPLKLLIGLFKSFASTSPNEKAPSVLRH